MYIFATCLDFTEMACLVKTKQVILTPHYKQDIFVITQGRGGAKAKV